MPPAISASSATLARPAEFRPPGYARLLDNIMLISNIRENGVPIGALPDGEMWFHHDMLHAEIPHKGTCLYSVEVPSHGGNTLFANCYRAYETMPHELADPLEGKRAFNSYNLGEVKRGDGKGVPHVKMSSHPVFRTHEETGRKAVNVNRLMTDHIEGMDRARKRPPARTRCSITRRTPSGSTSTSGASTTCSYGTTAARCTPAPTSPRASAA